MSRVHRLWWLAAGVSAIALLSACSANSTGGNEAAAAKAASSGAVKADKAFEHIHDLMLSDVGLLIGTHEGLWLQQGTSRAVLVGKSHFDVMGLARTPSGLIASGHPGSGEEQVNDLGLRGSENGGKSWQNISLFGQVDFHRLAASGLVVMGISARDGSLLRSDDAGKTWQTLSNPGLYDIAIDPADPSVVVGTTERGPVRSTDGGKSFTIIPSAPLLAVLSWDPAHVVGVAPEGALYESTDKGATWQKLAVVAGQPGALAVRGNEIALLAGSTVYYSTDGGVTFTERIVGVMGH